MLSSYSIIIRCAMFCQSKGRHFFSVTAFKHLNKLAVNFIIPFQESRQFTHWAFKYKCGI